VEGGGFPLCLSSVPGCFKTVQRSNLVRKTALAGTCRLQLALRCIPSKKLFRNCWIVSILREISCRIDEKACACTHHTTTTSSAIFEASLASFQTKQRAKIKISQWFLLCECHMKMNIRYCNLQLLLLFLLQQGKKGQAGGNAVSAESAGVHVATTIAAQAGIAAEGFWKVWSPSPSPSPSPPASHIINRRQLDIRHHSFF